MPIIFYIWGLANFFWQGFVFMNIWNWFPATIFNAPTINLVGSLGLLLITVFLREKLITSDADMGETLNQSVGLTFVYTFVLVIGFILKSLL